MDSPDPRALRAEDRTGALLTLAFEPCSSTPAFRQRRRGHGHSVAKVDRPAALRRRQWRHRRHPGASPHAVFVTPGRTHRGLSAGFRRQQQSQGPGRTFFLAAAAPTKPRSHGSSAAGSSSVRHFYPPHPMRDAFRSSSTLPIGGAHAASKTLWPAMATRTHRRRAARCRGPWSRGGSRPGGSPPTGLRAPRGVRCGMPVVERTSPALVAWL